MVSLGIKPSTSLLSRCDLFPPPASRSHSVAQPTLKHRRHVLDVAAHLPLSSLDSVAAAVSRCCLLFLFVAAASKPRLPPTPHHHKNRPLIIVLCERPCGDSYKRRRGVFLAVTARLQTRPADPLLLLSSLGLCGFCQGPGAMTQGGYGLGLRAFGGAMTPGVTSRFKFSRGIFFKVPTCGPITNQGAFLASSLPVSATSSWVHRFLFSSFLHSLCPHPTLAHTPAHTHTHSTFLL